MKMIVMTKNNFKDFLDDGNVILLTHQGLRFKLSYISSSGFYNWIPLDNNFEINYSGSKEELVLKYLEDKSFKIFAINENEWTEALKSMLMSSTMVFSKRND